MQNTSPVFKSSKEIGSNSGTSYRRQVRAGHEIKHTHHHDTVCVKECLSSPPLSAFTHHMLSPLLFPTSLLCFFPPLSLSVFAEASKVDSPELRGLRQQLDDKTRELNAELEAHKKTRKWTGTHSKTKQLARERERVCVCVCE